MADIDYIKLRPDTFGWTLIVYTEDGVTEYGLGDVIQFTEEVERTLGKWLADGPADFHNATDHTHARYSPSTSDLGVGREKEDN